MRSTPLLTRQKQALVAFVRAMGGSPLENVILVELAPVVMWVGEGDRHGSVVLHAGKLAKIKTRMLDEKDHICGNEITYYPSLSESTHAMPAVAVDNEYLGHELGVEWRIPGKRSAFVGTFSY